MEFTTWARSRSFCAYRRRRGPHTVLSRTWVTSVGRMANQLGECWDVEQHCIYAGRMLLGAASRTSTVCVWIASAIAHVPERIDPWISRGRTHTRRSLGCMAWWRTVIQFFMVLAQELVHGGRRGGSGARPGARGRRTWAFPPRAFSAPGAFGALSLSLSPRPIRSD